MPKAPWTREQAIEMGKRGRASYASRLQKRRELSALAAKIRHSLSPDEALEVCLVKSYESYCQLDPKSPQAERLSRTLLNLEQIRRIHTKAGRIQQTAQAAAAVQQSGPILPPIAQDDPTRTSPAATLSNSNSDEGGDPEDALSLMSPDPE